MNRNLVYWNSFNHLDSSEFYASVGSMNRAWKLILLGLVQAEPMSRYLAMFAIQKALPGLKRTLFEIETLTVRFFTQLKGNYKIAE